MNAQLAERPLVTFPEFPPFGWPAFPDVAAEGEDGDR